MRIRPRSAIHLRLLAMTRDEAGRPTNRERVVGRLLLRPQKRRLDLYIDDAALLDHLSDQGCGTPEQLSRLNKRIEEVIRRPHFVFTAGGTTPDGMCFDAGRTFEPWDPEGLAATSNELWPLGLRLARLRRL